MKIEKKKLQTFSDERGGILVPIEFKDLDFVPQRLFYVTDVPAGSERGDHAHYKTKQLLICVQGEITVRLHDGKNLDYITLFENEYLYINTMIWDAQQFETGNDVLLVLCSTNYDEKDYINDINEFINLTA